MTNQKLGEFLKRVLPDQPKLQMGDVVYLDSVGAVGEYVVCGLRLEPEVYVEGLDPTDVDPDTEEVINRFTDRGEEIVQVFAVKTYSGRKVQRWQAYLCYVTPKNRHGNPDVNAWGWVDETEILAAMARRQKYAAEKAALAS